VPCHSYQGINLLSSSKHSKETHPCVAHCRKCMAAACTMMLFINLFMQSHHYMSAANCRLFSRHSLKGLHSSRQCGLRRSTLQFCAHLHTADADCALFYREWQRENALFCICMSCDCSMIRALSSSLGVASTATASSSRRFNDPLTDQDRIFQNLYGRHDASLKVMRL
jgi:hypothetical protein